MTGVLSYPVNRKYGVATRERDERKKISANPRLYPAEGPPGSTSPLSPLPSDSYNAHVVQLTGVCMRVLLWV